MRRLFLILLCCGTLLTGCATRPTDPEECVGAGRQNISLCVTLPGTARNQQFLF